MFRFLGAVLLLLGICSPAYAFSLKTAFTDGCHEGMSFSALRGVPWLQDPPKYTETEKRVASDLAFGMPADLNDPWSLAYVVGVRDPDVRGASALDLPELAHVHGDPLHQHEHCLRASWQDGAEGIEQAIESCKAHIIEQLRLAMSGGSRPEEQFAAKQNVDVALVFRGTVNVEFARYPYFVGRALHALQDSFAHTFRSADLLRISEVFNWVDWIGDDYRADRDGHRHIDYMDACDDYPARRSRFNIAAEASAALLRALQSSEQTEERLLAAQGVLDKYMSYEAGCGSQNNWCDASERHEPDAQIGCSVRSDSPSLWILSLVCMGFFVRKKNSWRSVLFFALCTLSAVTIPPIASAHENNAVSDSLFNRGSLVARFSTSIDRGALAGSVGGRFRFSRAFETGVSVEYNPWFSLETGEFARGAFNAYASGVFYWFENRTFALNSSLHLGLSVLLFDLVGADKGSVGPFLGVNSLGVVVNLTPQLQLLIDPADVALAMPQVKGIPFYYLQYRFSVGIKWGF